MPGGMNGNELVDEVLRFKLGVKVLLTLGYSYCRMSDSSQLVLPGFSGQFRKIRLTALSALSFYSAAQAILVVVMDAEQRP